MRRHFLSRESQLARAADAFRAWVLRGEDELARDLRKLHGVVDYAAHEDQGREELTHVLFQSVLCGFLVLKQLRARSQRRVIEVLSRSAGPVAGAVAKCLLPRCDAGELLHHLEVRHWDELLEPITARLRSKTSAAEGARAIFRAHEQVLATCDAKARARHGVFCTPCSLARFVVRRADLLLKHEFGLDDGLADTTTWGALRDRLPHVAIPEYARAADPYVRILDPAAGTGVFLVEVIDSIHDTLRTKWRRSGKTSQQIQRLWNEYVPQQLLPRIFGVELLVPPAIVAALAIADKLLATGYAFTGDERIGVFVADTLAGPELARVATAALDGPYQVERERSSRVLYELPPTVILGNPPFSGLSENRSPWIQGLMRGLAAGCKVADYYTFNGQPVGERKSWLQDDYVKFIRYAHWCIERAGSGLIGFVTNHGYLDNASFRGLRQRLSHDFPRISFLDLHGNRKKKEQPPDGGLDENVFSVEQGVAVGMFRRPPRPTPAELRHGELWGPRDKKLDWLSRNRRERGTRFSPQEPFHLFVPRRGKPCDAYQRGWSLPAAMPTNCTAAITARDSFVIAFDKRELLERMRLFRDLRVSDAEIRRRFFGAGRSSKYTRGDTRGWNLANARRRMALDPDWEQPVATCLYRPFDCRSIYWADWMIDWPRREVMQHLCAARNVALITRRQMLPTQPCNYFWVADTIVIDGVIRSDNRGGEAMFPLYLYAPANERRLSDEAKPSVNLAPGFLDALLRLVPLNWLGPGRGDLAKSVGAEDVLAYVYALFHAPSYRVRHADSLRVDFPRIVLPASVELFCEMANLGSTLLQLHLNAGVPTCERRSGWPPTALERNQLIALAGNQDDSLQLGRAFPKYCPPRVLLADSLSFEGVDPVVWEFRVGGHQVCRKWLRDRHERPLTAEEFRNYGQILAAVQWTLEVMSRIDQTIARHGGWPAAFTSTAM